MLEPGPEIGITGQLGPDNLDRDRPAARRHAQEDLAHAAHPELSEQPVGPDLAWIIRLQSRIPHVLTPKAGKTPIHYLTGRRGRKLLGLHAGTYRHGYLRSRL